MPWQQIEASVAHLFSHRARTGEALPDLDLFGEAPMNRLHGPPEENKFSAS
jgi:IS5 family transposase